MGSRDGRSEFNFYHGSVYVSSIFFIQTSTKNAHTGRNQESAHLEANQGRACAAHAACVGEVTSKMLINFIDR
jgi:hypothetical protein